MKKINSESELRAAILQLEGMQEEEGKLLRVQFQLAYESIKPINLIKSTISEAIESKDIKDDIVNTAIGLTTGFLSKVLFEGKKSSPLKKLLGTALMFGITRLVAKNPETLKSIGNRLFKITDSR